MEPVRIVSGRAVPLDRSDVDTDQIIPSEWLKRIERTGFGAGLFAEWRDDPASSSTIPTTPERRSSSPGRTSAPDRRANTPCGRWSTTASGRSSARASATSSATTPRVPASCPPRSPTRRAGRLLDARRRGSVSRGRGRRRARAGRGAGSGDLGAVPARRRRPRAAATGPRRHRRHHPVRRARSTPTRRGGRVGCRASSPEALPLGIG